MTHRERGAWTCNAQLRIGLRAELENPDTFDPENCQHPPPRSAVSWMVQIPVKSRSVRVKRENGIISPIINHL